MTLYEVLHKCIPNFFIGQNYKEWYVILIDLDTKEEFTGTPFIRGRNIEVESRTISIDSEVTHFASGNNGVLLDDLSYLLRFYKLDSKAVNFKNLGNYLDDEEIKTVLETSLDTLNSVSVGRPSELQRKLTNFLKIKQY